MNLSNVILSLLLAKGITASVYVNPELVKAVEEEDFERIEEECGFIEDDDEFFDYVVKKDPDYIAKFINQTDGFKEQALAALFNKRPEMIDQVLGQIRYDDDDLLNLVYSRPALADPPENFLNVLDRITTPEKQEAAVDECIFKMVENDNEDLVIPLVDALDSRVFKSERLKDVAVPKAFTEGAYKDAECVVQELYEHPLITPGKYVDGLVESWNNGKPNPAFQFLASRADKGDLMMAKKTKWYKGDPGARKAINEAWKTARPAGTRRRRFFERVKLAADVLHEVTSSAAWYQEPGGIIASYLVGEKEWEGEMARIRSQKLREKTPIETGPKKVRRSKRKKPQKRQGKRQRT